MHSRKYQKGVNLIELMIVVTIVAILGAIAYPSYRNQLMRSHRSEAKAALLQIQVAQEKWFLQNNAYTNSLTNLNSAAATTNGYYGISLSGVTATTYTATAAAAGGQTDDTACLSFTINQTGARTPTAGCW